MGKGGGGVLSREQVVLSGEHSILTSRMLPLTFRGTEYYHAIAFQLSSGRSGSHSHLRTPSYNFPTLSTVVKRGIGAAALQYDHMAPVCPRVNSIKFANRPMETSWIVSRRQVSSWI